MTSSTTYQCWDIKGKKDNWRQTITNMTYFEELENMNNNKTVIDVSIGCPLSNKITESIINIVMVRYKYWPALDLICTVPIALSNRPRVDLILATACTYSYNFGSYLCYIDALKSYSSGYLIVDTLILKKKSIWNSIKPC